MYPTPILGTGCCGDDREFILESVTVCADEYGEKVIHVFREMTHNQKLKFQNLMYEIAKER